MSSAEYKQKEPLLRIEKKAELPSKKILLLRLLAVVLSLIAGGDLYCLCGTESFCDLCNDPVGGLQKRDGISGNY